LPGLIDFDKERERLERELGKLSGERDSLEKRLANSDFVQRAAPDVVTATQDRAAEVASQLGKLRAMIDAL
jgi:valyl-tRNA synthetase